MYDIAKDFVIPLIAPVVAIIVPTIFFYVIPSRWNRQSAAISLFNSFFSEDMRRARLEAWTFFVTENHQVTAESINERLDRFLVYLIEPAANKRLEQGEHDIFQKVSRVLDFFAIVDGCLERRVVEPQMVRAFLSYYYLWWRDMVMIPLRSRPLGQSQPMRVVPIWWHPLRHLDAICRYETAG